MAYDLMGPKDQTVRPWHNLTIAKVGDDYQVMTFDEYDAMVAAMPQRRYCENRLMASMQGARVETAGFIVGGESVITFKRCAGNGGK